MATLESRIMRLERVLPMPNKQRNALILVTEVGRDPDSLIGLYGQDLRRLPNETVEDFIDRMEAHLRATRGQSLPLIAFAQYLGDEN